MLPATDPLPFQHRVAHFAMTEILQSPGFSQVTGSINFQCSSIQTNLLIFCVSLSLSRSHLKRVGCRREDIPSAFLTSFPFNDSLQFWQICFPPPQTMLWELPICSELCCVLTHALFHDIHSNFIYKKIITYILLFFFLKKECLFKQKVLTLGLSSYYRHDQFYLKVQRQMVTLLLSAGSISSPKSNGYY